MQDLNDKVTGNSLTASEWNEVPSEIQNVITAAGITLSGADLNQLGKAIAAYSAVSTFYTDSGTADNYVLTPISSFHSPSEYYDGMIVRFIPLNANTGGSINVNVNGLGSEQVFRENSFGFEPDEFVTNRMVTLRYSSSDGHFKRVGNFHTADSSDGFGLVKKSTQTEVNNGSNNFTYVSPETLDGRTATVTRRGLAELATQTETDTGTDDERIVTPLKLQNKLDIVLPTRIIKTSDQSITGTTSVNVTQIAFSASANTRYKVKFYIKFAGVTLPDTGTLTVAPEIPSSDYSFIHIAPQTTQHANGANQADGGSGTISTSFVLGYPSPTTDIRVLITELELEVGGTGGTVRIEFTAGSSGSPEATILEGSYIEYLAV